MVSAPPKPQPLTCPKPMGEYLSRGVCGKKVKGQTDAGEWLCGVHLGAYNRVKKNRAAEKDQRARDAEVDDRTSSVLAELAEQYGISGIHYYGGFSTNCGGSIVVDAQELLELLTELSAT